MIEYVLTWVIATATSSATISEKYTSTNTVAAAYDKLPVGVQPSAVVTVNGLASYTKNIGDNLCLKLGHDWGAYVFPHLDNAIQCDVPFCNEGPFISTCKRCGKHRFRQRSVQNTEWEEP